MNVQLVLPAAHSLKKDLVILKDYALSYKTHGNRKMNEVKAGR